MLKRILLTILCGTAPAFAALNVTYTDWTSATVGASGSAVGSIGGIGVTYTGEVSAPTQTSGGINYYNPFTPYDVLIPPPNNDIIALTGGSTLPANKLTFSQAVTDPIMLIVSLGQLGLTVSYDFDAPFDVIDSGAGYWGGGVGSIVEQAGDVLDGTEGHGTIQFKGTFSSISWTASPSEYWHGFTIALPEQTTGVPDSLGFAPALGTVLSLFAIARRKKK